MRGLPAAAACRGRRRSTPAGAGHRVGRRAPGDRRLAELWGRSAFHCPYCHGFEVSDRRLAVLGAGPERVRLALQLTRFTGDLVLCSNGEPLTHDLAQLLAGYGVQVRSEAVARFEGGGGRLKRIILERGSPLERDAVSSPRPCASVRSWPAASAAGCSLTAAWRWTSSPGPACRGCMRPATWPPRHPGHAVRGRQLGVGVRHTGRGHARPGPDRRRLQAPRTRQPEHARRCHRPGPLATAHRRRQEVRMPAVHGQNPTPAAQATGGVYPQSMPTS